MVPSLPLCHSVVHNTLAILPELLIEAAITTKFTDAGYTVIHLCILSMQGHVPAR
jgi:hypothetical protein